MFEAMDADEFRRALRLGLGRAIFFLQTHGATAYRDTILAACMENTVFDPQVEPERSPYLMEVLQQTGEEDYYREPILVALQGQNNPDLEDQLFDLASYFAERGSEAAREVMYKTFAENAAKGGYRIGGDQIIRLDGIPGLLHVAQCLGEHLSDCQQCWEGDNPDGYLRLIAEEKEGEEAVRLALGEAAARDRRVAAYNDWVRAAAERQASGAYAPVEPYERLKQRLADGDVDRGDLRQWGRKANQQAIKQAARDLLLETNPGRLLSYLRIFAARAFPFSPRKLVPLVRGGDDQAWAALVALEHLRHPAVRALALELLPRSTWRGGAVRLLIKNYEPGDHRLIARTLAMKQNIHKYHQVGLRALEVFAANPTTDCADIMVTLYERGPCSNCRSRCFKVLDSLGILPDWMLEEYRYDAYTLEPEN